MKVLDFGLNVELSLRTLKDRKTKPAFINTGSSCNISGSSQTIIVESANLSNNTFCSVFTEENENTISAPKIRFQGNEEILTDTMRTSESRS